MRSLRRALQTVLALVAASLLVLPVVFVALAGWFSSERATPVSMERWTLLAVFIVVWGLTLLVGFVWAMDRLGARWRAYDRPPRTQRERRRLRAALRLEHALAEPPAKGPSRRRRERD